MSDILNINKLIIIYSTTPLTRRYTTLWNGCAQKSPCPTAKRSEPQRSIRPFKTDVWNLSKSHSSDSENISRIS